MNRDRGLTGTSRRRGRRFTMPLAALTGVVVVAWLGFRLFEPVWVYAFGWSPMPQAVLAPIVAELRDDAWTDAAAAGQTAMERLRAEIDAPALSAAVAAGGELVWRAAVGYADLDTRAAVAFDDRFRLGSTSKAVTAVAVGTLIDAHGIDLDAPIQRYVTAFPEKDWPVTLRQAMSHTAGIRNYGVCLCFPIWEHRNRRSFASVTDSIRVIADSPLQFEPGTRYQYTSLGYNLAGAAIETVSGRPFRAYLADAVFGPLGMRSSSLDIAPTERADTARFYEVEHGRYKPAFAHDNSIRWPSGGMLSTPTDMVRLGSAMLDDRLLSEAARASLLTVPAASACCGEGQGSGLGWRISDLDLGDGRVSRYYHHHGTAIGSTSVLVVLPEDGLVLSVMMNKGQTSAESLFRVARAILLAFTDPPAAGASPAGLSSSHAR